MPIRCAISCPVKEAIGDWSCAIGRSAASWDWRRGRALGIGRRSRFREASTPRMEDISLTRRRKSAGGVEAVRRRVSLCKRTG